MFIRIFIFLFLLSCTNPHKLNSNFIQDIKSGQEVDFSKFVEKGGDINHHDDTGKSAIHYAALENNSELIGELIDLGADINIQNFKKETALILAVKEEQVEAAKTLINRGADQKIEDSSEHSALYYAVKKENKDLLDLLASPDLLKRGDIFSLATSKISEDLILLMQEKGLKINDTTETHNSLLHYAIHSKNKKIIKYLLENNIDIDIQNSSGNTSIHEAKDIEIIKLLVAHGIEHNADFSLENLEGKTIFHVFSNECDILELLISSIENSKDLVNNKDKEANTPLHFASKEKCVNTLLSSGADVNAKNKEGHTPTFKADSQKIMLLLKAGSNINSIHDSEGDSVFAYLLKLHFSETDFVESLITKYNPDVNMKNKLDISPIHYVAMANPFWYSDEMKSKSLKVLIKAGSKLNIQDKLRGYTPLHYTAQLLQMQSSEVLLKAGSDPLIPGSKNMATAESLAISSDKGSITDRQKLANLIKSYGSTITDGKTVRGN